MCNYPPHGLLQAMADLAKIAKDFEQRLSELEKSKDERKQDYRLVYTKSCSLGDRSEICFQHHPQPCGWTVTQARR